MWNYGALSTVEVETGLIHLTAPPDRYSSQVRNEANPEGSGLLRPDFGGSGYVDFGNDAGDSLTVPISVTSGGTYDLVIRYAGRGGENLTLSVNGSVQTVAGFPATNADGSGPAGPFDSWGLAVYRVTLMAGQNNVALTIPAGATAAPNIDAIAVFPPGTAPSPATDTTADFGHNLTLTAPTGILNETEASAMNLRVGGLDADSVRVQLQIDGGAVQNLTGRLDPRGNVVIAPGELGAGSHQATLIVTDNDGNVAVTSTAFITAHTTPTPTAIEAEDASHVTLVDVGTGGAASITRIATQHAGASGGAYVDLGTNTGDGMNVDIEAPRGGIYTLTLRYANGDATSDRPMRLSVNDAPADLVTFPKGDGAASWTKWQTVTIQVELVEGANTLDLSLPAGATGGPNIDAMQLDFLAEHIDRPADAQLFQDVIAINFEPGSSALPADYMTPEGFVSDQGAGYGIRQNGMSFGWVDVDDLGRLTHRSTALPSGQSTYASGAFGSSDLYRTSSTFERAGLPATERAWEMAVENGTYQVRIAVGSATPQANSEWVLRAEGTTLVRGLTPDAGAGITSTIVTGAVTVADGRITLDSLGGVNTSIQWLELERVLDVTPADERPALSDYSVFADIRAADEDGQVSLQPGGGQIVTGIATDSDFVVGIRISDPEHRGPNVTYADNIRLIETATGREVPVTVQTTGGSDSLTISPRVELSSETSYTLLVDDVLDLGSSQDPSAPARQIVDNSVTFVTGPAGTPVQADVAFTDKLLLDGYGDGAGGFTSVEFGPDGRLYVATISGEIMRWDVSPDGSIDPHSREVWGSSYMAEGDARRAIIGLAFDPENPNLIWVTDNWPVPLAGKASETPEFSGRISCVTLGLDGSLENATAAAYISGLPRSGGDHVTNSLEFRANPDSGMPGEPNYLLYVTQGSNTSGGAPDAAWGMRPERLLNAAVLEIDPRRVPPPGGIDVRTEPLDLDDDPNTIFPPGQFNDDGTYPGSYDPFATDAPLQIYASGLRNAYDLVWHSNGLLYAPTNGSAAGANSPDDPSTPQDESAYGGPKQRDFLFLVREGQYYGHPNALLDNFILSGGNPTAGADPNEVGGTFYPVGTLPDPDYHIEDTYSLGYNVSPDGVIEYLGGAFGDSLQHALIFTQFSVTDALRYATIGADGHVIGVDTLRRPDGTGINNYIDPLDIIENPTTGQLYVVTLNRTTGASQLVMLTPAAQPSGQMATTIAALGATDGSSSGGATFFDGDDMTLMSGTDSVIRVEDDPATYEPTYRNDLDRNGLNDGHDGASYLDLGTVVGAEATVTYHAEAAGEYRVLVRLANGSAESRPLLVSAGDDTIQITDTRTGGFRIWKTVEVTLTLDQGANPITLKQLAGQGANIDSITVIAPELPGPAAEVRLNSLDPGIHEDRLHFNFITDPSWEGYSSRDYKEAATIRLHSEGEAALHITAAEITGPYRLANPDQLDDITIAPGQYLDVRVEFDRAAYAQRGNNVDGVMDGTLTIATNDGDQANVVVNLSGYCQPRPESGNEPNLNELFDIFGFGNRIEGLSYARGGEHSALDTHGLYLPVDETEVMASYWRMADSAVEVQVTQLAAMHSPGGATIAIHAPNATGARVSLFSAAGTDNQMVMPGTPGGQFAQARLTAATIPDAWAGEDVFAFRIAGVSSDPHMNNATPKPPTQEELNERYSGYTVDDEGVVQDPGGAVVPYGAGMHVFQAYDDDGNLLNDTYIVAMDYVGLNSDFNDNLLLVRGVEPVFWI